MAKIPFVIAVVFLFAVTGLAQGTCTRHAEPSGKFSYCPPAGWEVRDPKSGTFKIFASPTGSVIRANINVRTETTDASHDRYMMAALQLLMKDNDTKGEGATKMVGWTEFITDSKLRGSRLVYEIFYQGMMLRTVQYVLDMPGGKLILTGTGMLSNKDTTDKIFDGIAKSMRLER